MRRDTGGAGAGTPLRRPAAARAGRARGVSGSQAAAGGLSGACSTAAGADAAAPSPARRTRPNRPITRGAAGGSAVAAAALVDAHIRHRGRTGRSQARPAACTRKLKGAGGDKRRSVTRSEPCCDRNGPAYRTRRARANVSLPGRPRADATPRASERQSTRCGDGRWRRSRRRRAACRDRRRNRSHSRRPRAPSAGRRRCPTATSRIPRTRRAVRRRHRRGRARRRRSGGRRWSPP